MIRDLVAVTAAAAGAFAEPGGRVANHSVEDRPTAGHERGHARGPGGVERLSLGRRDDRRSTHVGGHIARSALHDFELDDLTGEWEARAGRHCGVASGVAGQRLQRLLLGPARTAPAWPVESGSEHSPSTEFDTRARCHAFSTARKTDAGAGSTLAPLLDSDPAASGESREGLLSYPFRPGYTVGGSSDGCEFRPQLDQQRVESEGPATSCLMT